MREKAIRYAVKMEVDVQFHTWTQRGAGRLYDFEDYGSVERGRGVIEVIKFRDHKSKNVLQNTKTIVGNSGGARKIGGHAPKRIKRKTAKVVGKMEDSNGIAKKEQDSDK